MTHRFCVASRGFIFFAIVSSVAQHQIMHGNTFKQQLHCRLCVAIVSTRISHSHTHAHLQPKARGVDGGAYTMCRGNLVQVKFCDAYVLRTNRIKSLLLSIRCRNKVFERAILGCTRHFNSLGRQIACRLRPCITVCVCRNRLQSDFNIFFSFGRHSHRSCFATARFTILQSRTRARAPCFDSVNIKFGY